MDGFFPIGVFGLPPYLMQDWVNLGCNTMLSVPQGTAVAEWDMEAQNLGLAMIRQRLGDGTPDIGRTDLLAWMLPDEPDVEANNGPCGGNCVDLVETLYSQWKAIDPSREIFVNLAGPNVLLSASCDYCNGPGDDPPVPFCYPNNDQCYPRILSSTDWVSMDIYPVTGWLYNETYRDDITAVGITLDRIKDWSDKPQFAIIEVGDQRLGFPGTGTRGPTPSEYRAELWHAVIHGARGIFYFPEAFNPFEWDNTTPAMQTEIFLQNSLLGDVGSMLQTEIDPAAVSVIPEPPLEMTWRLTPTEAWAFVLNTSNAAISSHFHISDVTGDAIVYGEGRSVPLVGDAVYDDFDPYAVHIYQLTRD